MIIAPRTDANIVTTNIAQIEAGVAVYDPTLAYSLNDVVQVNGTINRIYEATVAVPAGIDPSKDVDPITGIGTYWFGRGVTNYKRAFDPLSSSRTSNADRIYYKFGVSHIDSLMIDGVKNVKTIRVVVTNNVNSLVVFDKTFNMTKRDVYDWYDWTYNPTEYLRSFFVSLPMIFDASLEVYIDNTGATVEVGHIVYGRSKRFGLSLAKPSPISSTRSITSKKRDKYGNFITRRKARYKRMTINCNIDSKSVHIIENRLNDLADVPSIFIGDEREGGYKALLIYGELKDHNMPISVSRTTYQLQVEGYL